MSPERMRAERAWRRAAPGAAIALIENPDPEGDDDATERAIDALSGDEARALLLALRRRMRSIDNHHMEN